MKKLRLILTFLNTSEKKQASLILFFVFFMALLDTLGVASILPFISLLINPELIETNSILNKFYRSTYLLGVDSPKKFLFFFGSAVFFFFIFSLIIRSFSQYSISRFILMREFSISRTLMNNYLEQNYFWFLNRHSSEIIKNILSETNNLVNTTLMPVIIFISQTLLILTLIILLIIIHPILALSMTLVLTVSYFFIFYFIKKTLSKIGSQNFTLNKERFKIITEAFSAIKEIKITGLEQRYIDRFSKSAEIYAKNQSTFQIIANCPRYIIEGLAFGGVIILSLIFISFDKNFSNILPIISVYVFAGYRLMPALQQVYGAITAIRFSGSILNSIHKDLVLTKYENFTKDFQTLSFEKSIILKKIYFNFPDSKYAVLKNVNIEIPIFSKVGIIGATGSGKSTIVDIILGLLNPNEGDLIVDDIYITENNKRSWQKNIGYVPQQIYLSDASVALNIALGSDENNINYEAVESAAKIANIHEFIVKEMPEGYNTTIGERGVKISGGQRQRIGIARALYRKPKVLFLDEATSALDNFTEKRVIDAIQNLNKKKMTIICVTHRLSTIKNCDIIFLLDKGKIVFQGNYIELCKKNNKLK